MTPIWQFVIVLCAILYFAVCFGVVARRNGRSPWLWGILSVLTPINAVILGYWAVTGHLPFNGAHGKGNGASSGA